MLAIGTAPETVEIAMLNILLEIVVREAIFAEMGCADNSIVGNRKQQILQNVSSLGRHDADIVSNLMYPCNRGVGSLGGGDVGQRTACAVRTGRTRYGIIHGHG